ncbi:hypothetical protein B0H17DRAFT_1206437 [Mycena rosella]|uniref:Uncharacterized protein n=1 Tax=Mycena rosella TaxID=1033263 RepID=A0AAD7D4Y7_MYCRO|nr:hypothetical protein B0H17DRAFT_1206437 [Mycena rosella]
MKHPILKLASTFQSGGVVRFTTLQVHLFSANEPAAIYFPNQLQDEIEWMFLLMVCIHTEIRRQDVEIDGRPDTNQVVEHLLASPEHGVVPIRCQCG